MSVRRYIVRREPFGATVFDPQALSYVFVNRRQARMLAGDGFVSPGGTAESDEDPSGGAFQRIVTEVRAGASIAVRQVPDPLPVDSIAAPIRVYFEICLRCQASCSYCLNRAGSARPGELSGAEMAQLIENMGRDGVLEVRLTGGEPLLRPDFAELAQAVKRAGMALSVNSNLLHKREKIAELARLDPQLVISSLDASEEAHSANRGPGWRTIVENIRWLREQGIPLRINCALNSLTLPHLDRFVDEFAPLGCGFCFILMRPVGRAEEEFQPAPLSDLLDSVRSLRTKRAEYPGTYFSTSFDVVMDRELSVAGIDLTGCNALQKSFNVNSDGTVLPCAFFYELSPALFSLGNVRDHNFSVLPIWRSSERLQAMRRSSSDCNRRCIRCSHFRQDCLGSCIFMEEYSRLTGRPDPYCRADLLAAATSPLAVGSGRAADV
jgi:radical SAM protein with 4Fe4S-binding SPASM domain